MKKIKKERKSKVAKNQTKVFVTWFLLIVYYFMARFILGINYLLIFGFIILLFLLKVSLEKIALIFLSIAVIAYIFSLDVECQQDMSLVYIFIILAVIKYSYLFIRDRKNEI